MSVEQLAIKMASQLANLPSLRKQQLLSELYGMSVPRFMIPVLTSYYSSGLKQACPDGVFVSLTPGDPTLWSAVLFVRDGLFCGLTLSRPNRTDTSLRALRSSCAEIPNIFSSIISSTSPYNHLCNRYFPPSNHTLNDLHVYHRYPR